MIKQIRKKIDSYATNNYRVTAGDPDYEQVRFLNIVSVIGAIILTGFAIANIFISHDYFAALVELLLTSLIIINSIYLKKTDNPDLGRIVGTFVIYAMSYNNIIRGGFNGSGYLLLFAFPALIFFLNGVKRGIFHTILFISSLLLLYRLDDKGIMDIPISNFDNTLFIISLGITSILILLYQVTNESTQSIIKKQAIELKKAKETLENKYELTDEKKDQLTHLLEQREERNKLLEDTKTAMLNILEDIEEEKVEKEIQAQELQKFKEAVEHASDHILITDSNGTILYANKAVSKITGYSREEVLGNTPALWGKQMSEKFYKGFWHTIKDKKKTFDGEVTNRRKNGDTYIAEIHVSPILNRDGEVKFFMGLERDITKEKEIDKMKTEFVSVASHQLRTPLTSMKWFLELLLGNEAGKLSKQQADIVDNVYQSNERMITLVNDLLNVSRIETGKKFTIEKHKADMIKVIDQAIKENTMMAKKSKIDVVKTKSMPKKLVINIDKDKFGEVFNNLINNAIKYTKQGGSVEVGYEKKGKKNLFWIKDNGVGIPKENQGKIFKKFYRAENVLKMQTEGTGLGLYIVKAIVEGHGGKIHFESKEGKGTTFFIKL